MAQVAENFYELAKSDSSVIGINIWNWGGYADYADYLGSRELPQSVRDAHARIGIDIIKPQESSPRLVIGSSKRPAYEIVRVKQKGDKAKVRIRVRNVRVGNEGYAASPRAQIGVTIQGLQTSISAVSKSANIGAGDSKTFKVIRLKWEDANWPTSKKSKVYPIKICAIEGGAAADTDKSGNCFIDSLTVSRSMEVPVDVNAGFAKIQARNAKNTEVARVQQFLQDQLYLESKPTGNFGAATEEAVKGFQADEGLVVTGTWDTSTIQTANEILGFEEGAPEPITPPPPAFKGTIRQTGFWDRIQAWVGAFWLNLFGY